MTNIVEVCLSVRENLRDYSNDIHKVNVNRIQRDPYGVVGYC